MEYRFRIKSLLKASLVFIQNQNLGLLTKKENTIPQLTWDAIAVYQICSKTNQRRVKKKRKSDPIWKLEHHTSHSLSDHYLPLSTSGLFPCYPGLSLSQVRRCACCLTHTLWTRIFHTNAYTSSQAELQSRPTAEIYKHSLDNDIQSDADVHCNA